MDRRNTLIFLERWSVYDEVPAGAVLYGQTEVRDVGSMAARETMSSIGRHFNRASSSIFPHLAQFGGIRPPARKRSHCAFHAGDPSVIQRTIQMAKAAGVTIGAHPSFMDLYGFGRRRIAGERPEDLRAQLIYQIAAIQGMTAAEGHPMTHVKTHGALGNMAAIDPDLAAICADAVATVDSSLIYISLPYSQTYAAAEKAGLTVACEIYADRSYTDVGELTSRGQPGAVIHDVQKSTDQVLEMVLNRRIITTGGKRLPVDPATLCIHGDTKGAPQIAAALRAALETNGVKIAPFADPRRNL